MTSQERAQVDFVQNVVDAKRTLNELAEVCKAKAKPFCNPNVLAVLEQRERTLMHSFSTLRIMIHNVIATGGEYDDDGTFLSLDYTDACAQIGAQA